MSYINYNRTGVIIEIIVRDESMKKIEHHKFNSADKKLGAKILKHVSDKYGFKPEIETPEPNWFDGESIIE